MAKPRLVVHSGGPRGDHVCTWCGTRRETREALERHWSSSPSCGRNRGAVNAYRPDSQTFGERPIMPGEWVLDRVKCGHPMRLNGKCITCGVAVRDIV